MPTKMVSEQQTRPIGQFAADDLTGAATYTLAIAVPPLPRGPLPELFLCYDSNAGDGLAGAGWRLFGIPALRQRGNRYHCDGKSLDVRPGGDGVLTHVAVNGNRVVFGQKLTSDQWQATRIEDIFGNFVDFTYDDGKPQKIAYGLSGEKAQRSVIFRYGDDGLLDHIATSVGGEAVRSYDLRRDGHFVREIVVTGHGETGDIAAAVTFAMKEGRLAEIAEPSGLVTAVDYGEVKTDAGVRIVVTAYCLKVRGLAGGEEYHFSRRYAGGQADPDHGWTFTKAIEWDDAARAGRQVVFGASPELARKIICIASFAKTSVTTQGEHTVAFSHGPGMAEEFHVKTAETLYAYDISPEGVFEPRVIAIEEMAFAESGQPLFTKSERISYTQAGLPARRQTDDTTEFYDYVRLPDSTPEIYLPAGVSLYAGVLDTPDEGKRLKGGTVHYEFGASVPTAVHQRSWIDAKTGLSAPESTTLDATGNPSRLNNALGVETVIDYDAFHFACKVTHTGKDGGVRVEEYQTDPAHGGRLWSRDHTGVTRKTVFDALGASVEERGIDLSRPETWGDATKLIKLAVRKWRRDAKSGLVVRETLGGEQRLRDYIDGLGRIVRTERKIGGAQWQAQLTAYGALHRVSGQSLPYLVTAKTKSEPAPQWVEKISDGYGREVGEKFPDGRSIIREFSTDLTRGSTTIRSYAAPTGGEKHLISLETYDRSGLIEKQAQPDSAPTRFEYDALGRLARETDPTGVEARYVYDGLDRLVREENPVRGVRAYAFDTRGLLARATLNDMPIAYDYDAFGRVVCKTVATDVGGKTEPNIYRAEYLAAADHPGERVIETLPDGHQVDITFAPHGVERMRTVTLKGGPTFTLARDFYATGEEAATTYPNGARTRRVYASSGMLRKVLWAAPAPQNWGALDDPIVEYRGHDAYGRPALTHLHNGVSEVRTCDDFGQTTSLTIGRRERGAVPYVRQEYVYTAIGDGRLSELVDRSDISQPCTFRFGYDETRRLRTVEHSFPGKTEYIDYGVIGNVTKIARPSGSVDLIGASPYRVDGNGNVISKRGKNQTWDNRFDADNRLLQTSANKDGATATTTFAYDMDGVRVVKTDPDGVRTLYVAEDYLVALYPDGGMLGTIKVQGADGAVACVTEVMAKTSSAPLSASGRYAPGVLYIHHNNLGSTILATDGDGAKVASVGFDASGRIDGDVSDGVCNFELYFAGMLYDPTTALYYAGDRYYDADGMRFLSPDRARASSDPYGYASGDPINYFDWDGQCGICERLKKWWRKAKTCRVGSRLSRVFTVIVGVGGMTFTVISGWLNPTLINPSNLVGTMVFMLTFSVANQTLDYITTGRHNRSCLRCLWDRMCCCRAFCIANRGTVSLVMNTAISTILYPVSYLIYNAFAGSNAVGWEVILWSLPRGVAAGLLSSLTFAGVYSADLPMLRFAGGSVFGSVLTELLTVELAYLAFTAGDVAVQVLFVPSQYFNIGFQGVLSRALLIIAPFTSRANPLVAMLPISNIPWVTTGPMLLEDGSFAPFWPCLCGVPPEDDPSHEESSIIVEVVDDDDNDSNQQSHPESSHENDHSGDS